MAKIWGILRQKEKIALDLVIELQEADLDEALDQLCHQLDIPRPVPLRKHRDEFERFYRTRFTRDDFIESLPYTAFEVEVLRMKKQQKEPGYD